MSQDTASGPPQAGEWALELIDGDRAAELMRGRAPNRPIVRGRLDLYARHMQAGTWTLTHQGICLDVHGRLVDGQHRVGAIEHTKLAQWVWVYRERDASTAMPHFDKHQQRTTIQTIHLAGLSATKELIAAARAIIADGDYRGNKSWLLTDEDIWAHVEHNREWISDVTASLAGASGYGGATFVACCVRAIWRWPKQHSMICRFCEIVGSGVADGPADSAAIRYRDWVRNNSRGGGASVRAEIYFRCVSALFAFIEGRPLSKLYRADADPFVGMGLVGKA